MKNDLLNSINDVKARLENHNANDPFANNVLLRDFCALDWEALVGVLEAIRWIPISEGVPNHDFTVEVKTGEHKYERDYACYMPSEYDPENGVSAWQGDEGSLSVIACRELIP